MAKKAKSSKTKTKSSKSSHKKLFKDMAHKISKEWAKYKGPLDYAHFTKKMWKEHGHKKSKK